MADDLSADFPVWALLPKKETTVSNFLNKYPQYDGRGVTIAILDSGVDPGAPGLQKTSDGKVKISHLVNATGAGDVDTSAIVESVEGVITGLSGRKLKIPSSWKNPTGKYHIGLKNGYELYAKPVKERVQKDYKEKQWDCYHKIVSAEATRKLHEFTTNNSNTSQLSQKLKFEKEEYEAQVDILNTLEKKYNDGGPSYDCIVFHDGSCWRAVLDTTEVGDLESCTVVGEYDITHQYATLSYLDQMNYTINVYDDGNLLEIVTTCSAHGTHVASIAAAHFPDEPEKNGVAPGAQIFSIAIGDGRVGTMERGSALVRALIKVIESNCDVVNLSYGEQSNWNGGRVMEMFDFAVYNHGVIVVSSAGNDGPALTTTTTPSNGATSSVISVGAYVTPDMMTAEYSLREKKPGLGYTWASRGPGASGDLTVSLCAPGAAITSVPNWLLRGTQLMNGSSMSSPNVAGCICVLLSGLKAEQIPYSPYSVRRAMENTALKPSNFEVFSMGHGLIQVEKAWEYLTQYSNGLERDLRFNITCNNKKGVYLREHYKTLKPTVVVVNIEPLFLDHANANPENKIKYQQHFKLSSDDAWVSVPANLSLMYTSRAFTINVDPSGLTPGAHFTWVKGFDSTCLAKGPVFCIPVTVIISKTVESTDNWIMNFPSRQLYPGKLLREFIDVPAGATWTEFKMKSLDTKHSSAVRIHTIQLRPHLYSKTHESYKLLRLGPQEELSYLFQVKEKRVLEIAVTQWWTQLEPVLVNYTVSFHGLLPSYPQVAMIAADGIHRIDVSSNLLHESMCPAVSLKSHVVVYRPSDNKILPLKERDIIPKGRQIYEIQLTYNISLAKSVEIVINCSLISDFLYECDYESQLWMLFDCNKQLVTCGDSYPNRYNVKVEKGDYVLKLQVRHEQKNLLEKLTDLPLLVQSKLPSTITLDVFDKTSAAIIGGKKICSKVLPPGSSVPVFIAPLANDKLPKNVAAGHYLLGTITYSPDDEVKKADTYPFKYVITEMPKKSSSPKPVEKEKNLEEEFSEAVRDLKVSCIAKLQGKASKELFEELVAKDPKHIPLLLARLNSLDQDKERSTHLLSIVELANQILSLINTMELLAFFGAKSDKKDTSNHKQQEKQKSTVIETLTKKGIALCDYLSEHTDKDSNGANSFEDSKDSKSVTGTKTEECQPEQADKKDSDAVGDNSVGLEKSSDVEKSKNAETMMSEIDAVYCELQKWIDMTDVKVAHFTEKHALIHGHHGRALKLLLKQQEEKPVFETDKKCIDLYKKLNWNYCLDFFERNLLVRYPVSYRLF